MKKPLKTFAWIALVSGLLSAGLSGCLALDNNNQGEYRDQITGVMHWNVFIPVIAIGFTYASGLVFGILGLGLVAYGLIKTGVTAARR